MKAWEVFLLLCLLAAAGVLLYVPRESVLLNFDCSAYAVQSVNIAHGLGNTMRLGGENLPGFYPPGYPALTALCHLLVGEHLQNGVYVNLFFALLTLLLTWRLGRSAAGPAAGVLAFLFLLLSPMFRHVTRHIYSQMPSLFCVVLAAALLVAAARSGRWTALFLMGAAGLTAGLSVFIRANNVVLLPAAACYPLLGDPAPGAGKKKAVIALWGGLALAAASVALYNQSCYGSPMATGYARWGFEIGHVFSLHYLFHPPFVQMDPGPFPLVRWISGNGMLYPWPVALCALAGCVDAFLSRKHGSGFVFRRLVLFLLWGTFFLYLFLSLYFFRSPIYAMLFVPLVAVAAAAGLIRWLVRLPSGSPAWAWIPAWIPALVAAGFLVPAFNEAPLAGGAEAPPQKEVAVLRQVGARLEKNAALLGAANPVLVEYLVTNGTDRKYLFMNRRKGAQFERLVERELGPGALTMQKTAAWVRRSLDEGRPVYFLVFPFMNREGALLQETYKFLKKRFRLEDGPLHAVRRIFLKPRKKGR